jgi:hypothetical protein
MCIHSTLKFIRKAGSICAFMLAAGILGGCAQRYDVTLTNSEHLINIRKPMLNAKGGYYSYLDAHGQTHTLPATRVVEIDPH